MELAGIISFPAMAAIENLHKFCIFEFYVVKKKFLGQVCKRTDETSVIDQLIQEEGGCSFKCTDMYLPVIGLCKGTLSKARDILLKFP